MRPSAIRLPAPEPTPLPDPTEVILDADGLGGLAESGDNVMRVEFPDGSISINLSPTASSTPEESKEHTTNLALHIGAMQLGSIAEQLLRLIDEDERDQEKRISDLAKGLELLGIKYEEPRTEPNEEGLSVVRHPALLEAILLFQANCRGEMLPSDGPVKTRNDGSETAQTDDLTNALEKDFNHYLTVGAPEYYPDTDRMFFSLGFGGEAYKKVYHDPLKRRPVSMTVDRKDLIISDGSVALEACPRITHRLKMPPSTVRRMQLVGAWRDVDLGQAVLAEETRVDRQLNQIAGMRPSQTSEPQESDRIIFECYSELDIPGFEHEEKGEATGLPLPYRVTIDKDSREVLEIRRWWRDGDEMALRKEVFVEYVFVPGPGGLNLGLFHVLGNATRALTAAWRIALDNGMAANFPGGLVARVGGRQQTTNIRVGPGQLAPIDTGDLPIKDAVMPLPYRDVTPGFLGVIKSIEDAESRLAGTANIAVGEGRQDAPVGTTLAMIDQATKILGAVHKRMHEAQGKEFGMLKDLFREDPAAMWRNNRKPALPQDADKLVAALNDANIVPASDPNTASHMMRVQKAIAVKTLAGANPHLYDMAAVDRRVMQMVGIEDADELFAKVPPQGMGVDPSKMIDAQAKQMAAQAKFAEVKVKALGAASDAENRAADRESKERLQLIDLAQTEAVHPEAISVVDRLAQNPPFMGPPMGGLGAI